MDLIVDFPGRSSPTPTPILADDDADSVDAVVEGERNSRRRRRPQHDDCEDDAIEHGSPLSRMLACPDHRPRGGDRLIVDFPHKTSSPPRRVEFAHEVRIALIDNDATHRREELWHTAADLASFSAERERTVAMIRVWRRFGGREGSDPVMDKYVRMRMARADATAVGLEHYVMGDVSFAEMTKRREEHGRAVLEEQRCQRRGSGSAEEAEEVVARTSRGKSEWARGWAREIGTFQAEDGGDDYRSMMGVASGPRLPTPPSA